MKNTKYLLLTVLAVFAIQSVGQAKPEGAIKAHKKPSIEKKEDLKDEVKRAGDGAELEEQKGKAKKEKEKVKKEKEKAEEAKGAKGEAKESLKEKSNKSDKTDAIRNEEGKGSETGQAKRAENSRKWWKFWGD